MTGESCSPMTPTPTTSASKVCQARGNSAWYVPPPTGTFQPHVSNPSPGGLTASTVACLEPSARATKSEKPSATTGSNR